MFQNCFRIFELQESSTTYKCTWCMKKRYNLKYNKTKECEILIFGDDLNFWSFFKMKH